MDGLFREEVLLTQRSHSLGTINLATPMSFRWWLALVITFTLAIFLFLVFGHYTRRETVSGELLPSEGLLTLTAQTTGTVTRALVHEGQRVSSGQPLAEISGDLATNLGDTRELVGVQLRAQEGQLRTTLANLRPQSDAQTKDLRSRAGMLRAQIAQIDDQLALQREQAAASTHLIQQAAPLQQSGVISKLEFDQYRATALSDQAGIKTLERQRLDTSQQLSTLQAQFAQLPLDFVAKANQMRGQLAQLDAQLAENEAQRGTVLSAPRSGTVSTLLVKPGQNVASGQPLLSILPQGSKLEAQLLVPSSAIGFIKPGNRVVLRYEAYPYQKFGQNYGHVLQVSSSALSHGEFASLTGQAITVPRYRVLVALDRQSINADGEAEALKPGMALNADIMLDRSSLWQWMFDPLHGLSRKLDGGRHG